MTLGIVRAISTLAALAVATVAPALAQREPTLSDIAGCNDQAATRTGASALPHPGSGTTEAAQRGPSPTPRGEATSPGIVPGPADPGVGKAPKPGASVPTPGSGGPREKTDPSGSVITESPDPLVKGMDASKADDPRYRAAYRECMRAKLRG
jgi:hypothetical protein